MRVFIVDGVYYADLRVGDRRIRRSTRCTDRKAAEAVARQWERDAADPDHAATSKATLSDALKLLTDDRAEQAKAGRRSEGTASFYRAKAGHWTRILESNSAGAYVPFPLAKLHARNVDAFISQRRAEGAGENTISKELTALRAALKLAKRAGIWKGDVDAVLPIGFAPEYKPRDRALTYAEAQRLLAELTPDRAARVAFIVATSANWNESERARREDVAKDLTTAIIRGTKNAARHREVPIVSNDQRSLLEHALTYAQGPGDPLFTPWLNVRRDLHAACERAKIPPISPNDLRRTCATWLRAQGAPPHLIAPVLGHVDSRMVERVYGRLPIDQLAARLSAELGQNSRPYVGLRRAEPLDPVDALHDALSTKTLENEGFMVPRDGIEPPTRGFSILCSTD
ncbi:MAG: integrase family protein [Myxococcaceae bacterium]|nr:integrase family protein [Myxococcaceae bacterium]